tara:strand:+ start:857 stop:1378 length:522 start_codon:yes stop_codon:yes gene_type:complete
LIKVFENFLPEDEFKTFQDFVAGDIFPWFWNPSITYQSQMDLGQFTHTFFCQNRGSTSDGYPALEPLLTKLMGKGPDDNLYGVLYRAKANLNPRQSTNVQLGDYHADFPVPCETAIYYVNTNNGYTKFEDVNDVIYSQENTLVVFPSQIKHVGHACTDAANRIVLNLNYITFP